MANSNAPQGLTPRRYRNGAPWNGVLRTYFRPATDANALFAGDPVLLAGTGDSAGVPGVIRAGVTGQITGVVVGFRPVTGANMLIPPRFLAASTAGYVLVADDPALLFEIQESGTGAPADIGLNANLVAGAGNQNTGISGYQLDSTTKAVTNTLQLRIVAVEQRADNVPGVNNKLLVAINLPTETGAAGSTGL